MKLTKRRANRIKNYDYSIEGAYFITICSKDRIPVFSSIKANKEDIFVINTPYGDILEKYIKNVPEIEKYIIMPDHVHMIIRLHSGPMWASAPTDKNETDQTNTISKRNKISDIVRSIKTLTSKEVGKSIFQRSYYDHIIRNQKDYNEIWEYIENNPRKWVIEQQGRK